MPQNFCHTHRDGHTHTHREKERDTHRYFPEIVKSCSGHPESIKNRKSKICTIPILSSIYIKESKNATIKVGLIIKDSTFER